MKLIIILLIVLILFGAIGYVIYNELKPAEINYENKVSGQVSFFFPPSKIIVIGEENG